MPETEYDDFTVNAIADAVADRLTSRGLRIEGSFIADIGMARVELQHLDAVLRRTGAPGELRGIVERTDNLLRQLLNAIVRAPFAGAA